MTEKTIEERIKELEYKEKIDEINSRGALKVSYMGVRAYDDWMLELLNAKYDFGGE